jgi:DNA-binding NtrC family response regulator
MSQPKVSLSQSVLFIDDQTKFEHFIRGGLFSFPAEYEYCPSRISTAKERFKGETPDLIVATMEYLDGSILDLIQSSQGFLERVPAMFISEPHLADVEAELARSGRFQVVERSIDPLDLIRKMAQVIAENANQSARNPRTLPNGVPGTPPLDWAQAVLKRVK